MAKSQVFYTAGTSISHVFGNVTKAIEMYVSNRLPQNLIQDTTISTRSAFRYFKRFQNTEKEWHKKKKPLLIIRPIMEQIGPSDTGFMNNTLLPTFDGSLSGFKRTSELLFHAQERGLINGTKVNTQPISS